MKAAAPQRTSEWLHVYSDGASRGNPGPAGAGAQARNARGEVLLEISDFLGTVTNNVAEYWALILILEASRSLGYRRIKAHMDSQLVANQITGGYRVKKEWLKPLVARVRTLLDEYQDVEVQYIPRENNTECDALANSAVNDGLLGLKAPLLTDEDGSLF